MRRSRSPAAAVALALLVAACAQAPVAPPATPAPPSLAPAVSASTADAIARYRKAAEAARQAGDLATAAAQWHVVTLLAPEDDAARRELAGARAAIAKESREQLAAGQAALAAGDVERATQALLRVLALDPAQPDAAKALRDIDRRRFTRIQADRAAKVTAQEQAAQRGAGRPATMANGDADGFDVEQALEMLRAGDAAGGVRDLKAYVDANPGNRAARQRIASAVAERAKELEDKGARENALALYEQANALRGDQGGAWVARMAALRKALARDYFDKGSRAFNTNLAQAIVLLEASVRYDPSNALAAAKLKDARAAQAKLSTIK